MRVAVIGLGNVGTTLTHLLDRYRSLLGISFVRAIKNFPSPWTEPDLALLAGSCDELFTAEDVAARLHGLSDIDVAFDCRKEGSPRRERELYDSLDRLRSVIVQGSEHGFGIPFVAGINESALTASQARRTDVQVMSCNTHGTASLLRALAGGSSLVELDTADFVVVRRSEDVGAKGRLVGANVVARHRTAGIGTHHCEDALKVFASIGTTPSLSSSDVTTPSQLLHAVRFSLCFREHRSEAQLRERVARDPWLSGTNKFDSNQVFELGRRYGFQGRLYAHAIVVDNNLLITDRRAAGWAFIPQEGNTLLSTLIAFATVQLNSSKAAEARQVLLKDLIQARL